MQQSNPWAAMTPNGMAYTMAANSCMAPHTDLPSFMGLAQSNQLGLAQANQMAAAHQMAQVHQQHPPGSMAPPHGPLPVQTTPSISMNSCSQSTIEPCHDTERRSSSIAALRLKAREHSAAMGILSVYGK